MQIVDLGANVVPAALNGHDLVVGTNSSTESSVYQQNGALGGLDAAG